MTLLLAYVALALGVSFMCSLLEATLLSLTPTYLASIESTKPQVAKRWRLFKQDIGKPLAAILSLNTIAHTVGAAGAGAQATELFGDIYFGLISAVLTILILVLSEIIPKTLGTRYCRELAPTCGYLLKLVQASMYPLVICTVRLTDWLSPPTDRPMVSREDFRYLVKVGQREGVLDAKEAQSLSAMFAFRGLTAQDVMTPRTVITSLHADITIEQAAKIRPVIKFSRIPIFNEGPDDIIGFIRKDDLYERATNGDTHKKISSLKRDLLSIPETKDLPSLMQIMVDERHPMALIVTEYGDPLGIATMEDLVETMIGMEIVDESDSFIDMQARARELWRQRAKKTGLVTEKD
ncbi:CNNM domain-containing protein [Burkholderiales bacterium]|nr:CNNM domain-containing protein [Burkholderiales bacterium]